MDSLVCARLLLAVSMCVCGVTGIPADVTIDCSTGSEIHLGSVIEEYEGDLEEVHGISEAGGGVKLVDWLFPEHLEFLELSFTPGQTTATVRTRKALDADVLTDSTLFYSIMCNDRFKLNNSRTLTVIDINDHGPVFEQKLYETSVSETQGVDSEVLRVEAVDGDSTAANNRVSYSAVAPSSDDFIVTNSGAFILKRRLNYNAVQRYNFTVEARDNEGWSDRATVLIHVDDFDNLNPYFSHSLYHAFIPEGQTGPLPRVHPDAIKAQDGDSGINMTVMYSITAVSPGGYLGSFHIDGSSGVLTVLTAIDREAMDAAVIFVSIKATQEDDSSKTGDAVVSVTVEDINDNAPEFDQSSYQATIPENSPNDAVLFSVIVTDPDQGGFLGTLQILPESSPFSISLDGTVRVKNSRALDRETTPSFTFQIEAREQHPPNHISVVNVSVTLKDENDNSPVFTSSKYEGKVYADQFEGMSIVQVEAEDADDGVNGRIKYSIDFGNKDGFFSINETTGDIALEKKIPLEENRILEFSLSVTARDGGEESRSSSVQVEILAPGDSNPQFLKETYIGTIEENLGPGAEILKVTFLSVSGGIPANLSVETEGDKFNISSSGDLTTKVKLDYDEGPHNYSVEISISDGTNSDRAVVEVHVTDVNDNGPIFVSSSVSKSVPEDAEVGCNVTDVPATDKDSSFNGEIRYSLQGGEGKFFIDSVTGMVSVAGPLDRETKAEYSLKVLAEDQGRPVKSATANLQVQVSDINDNAPVFSEAQYEAEVSETESEGTSLLTLSAVDPDEGANGRVTYSILQQNPPSAPAVFTLDSSTGTLRLAQTLDYSLVKEYRLMVQAADGGTPSLVGNASVVLRVKDVNNNPPEFSKNSYDVAVSENLGSGASILTLEVTDRDEGGFSKGFFIYNKDTFDINKQGVVSLRRDVTLDRETKDRYTLQVMAVDQVTDGLNTTTQLNITVLDYNDNAPQFPALPDLLPIPEGNYSEESPGEVFTIVPTDADLGLNGEVTLSFASPNPLFTFREDGTLLVVGVLDRESRDTFQLLVKASDKGRPQRENFTTVSVSVTDVNDNRPEFSSSSYERSILLSDAEDGKLLLTLHATDRDLGDNALVSYSFCAGASPYVALNSQTGAVTLTSDLANVTEDTTLELTAMAEDHGRPRLNSSVNVVINLRTVSLVEGVAFLSSAYNFSLAENQTGGVAVGKVRAESGSDLYDVGYSLKTHTDLFAIDASGAITAKRALDKESEEWFILEVQAVDTRTPPTSAVAMVRVQVEDVNEAPQFLNETYEATIFSIAPYKAPVIHVKATDPDVGEGALLVYSLSAGDRFFDVDASTGLVYVVSVAGLAGQTITVEVKAKDPRGLQATTKVEVEVKGSDSSSDLVTLILNLTPNVVEKKVPELEKSLGEALGWTVSIIQVSSTQMLHSPSPSTRGLESETLVSFIAADGGRVISSAEVSKKLQSESSVVRAALESVFGEGLHYEEAEMPRNPAPNQTAVITLAVFLALSILGLLVTVFITIRFSRKKKPEDSDRESFDINRHMEGYANSARKISESSEGRTSPRGGKTEDSETREGSDHEKAKRDSIVSGTAGTQKDADGTTVRQNVVTA